jgi:hypothetical protein
MSFLHIRVTRHGASATVTHRCDPRTRRQGVVKFKFKFICLDSARDGWTTWTMDAGHCQLLIPVAVDSDFRLLLPIISAPLEAFPDNDKVPTVPPHFYSKRECTAQRTL